MAKTELLQLSIDELLLDLENPRLGSLANQTEALEALIRLNQKHFKNLAQSIKTHGLDPGDSLYVIAAEEGGDYTVVEGNRRLSALMVLNNPSVLEPTSLSAAEKKSLGGLTVGFDRTIVQPIRCTAFHQRSEANEWIYRRHTGSADGEGRINWGPLEIQRFAGDRTVLDVIEFMHRNGGYREEEWSAAYEALANNSSTLSRFLESKACREFLGLSTRKAANRTIPEFTAPVPFVIQVLRHIFADILEGRVNTRTHNKAGEIEAYFAALRDTLTSSKDNGTKPECTKAKAFRDVQEGDSTRNVDGRPPASAPENQARPKTTRARSARVTLAPRSHEFKQPETTKGQALIREAGRLNADDFPLASAFLLRAFLEHTIDGYMGSNKIPRWEANTKGVDRELGLQTRAERVIRHIVDNQLAAANDLRGVTSTLSNKGDPASIQSLNDYHHASYRLPIAETLRAAWDSAVPLFIAVYGKA